MKPKTNIITSNKLNKAHTFSSWSSTPSVWWTYVDWCGSVCS